MGAAYFYQLSRSSLEEALRLLLPRALGQGWRVAVRGTSEAGLKRLDEVLWLEPAEGFLPHGLAGGERDADQPVLLTREGACPNGAACVMAIYGAEVTAEEAGRLQRVCVIFDGADAAALERARGQWKVLTGAGVAAQYWSEEGGRWEKKAER